MILAHETERLEEIAADWVLRLNDAGEEPSVRRAFDAWRAADPAHAAAFEDAKLKWRKLSALPDVAAPVDMAALDRPLPRERMVSAIAGLRRSFSASPLRHALLAAGAAASVALVFSVYMIARSPFVATPSADHQTTVAEIRDVILDDGSIITLGAATGVDVDFTTNERRISLGEGEAFFDIASDPSRPFVVVAGDAVVTVVGTKFDVRRSGEQVRVSVLEGIVNIAYSDATPLDAIASTDEYAVRLTAGEQAVAYTANAVIALEEVGAAAPGAWRSGRLAYDRALLREVIFDANRYYDGEIVIASDTIADLEVTTSFRAGQIEALLETLDVVLPVDVERRAGGRVVLTPAQSG